MENKGTLITTIKNFEPDGPLKIFVDDRDFNLENQRFTFEDFIKQELRYALIEEFESEYGFRISFPVIWGEQSDGGFGPGVKDPLTIDLCSDLTQFRVRYSLGSALIHEIEVCERDGSFRDGLQRFSKAMRVLCDRIDACGEGSQATC